MFENVYLTLKGGRKTDSFEMSAYFNDVDSLLKYTLSSTDATVAKAEEKNGTLTITAMKDGTATITVTASDDEGSSTASADISVTVVKENAAPTTHGLNRTDRTNLLEKRLYYRDGPQTRTVTVVANPGAVVAGAAGSVTDSILADDFKVVIGKAKASGDDDTSDNKIKVAVTKTGAHSYSIVITPNDDGFGGLPSQMVRIYPKDMFGAMVKDPWEFEAMYNTPPRALVKTFNTIELYRSAGTSTPTSDVHAERIMISEYFDVLSLERMPLTPAANGDPVTIPVEDNFHMVGDTVCTVSPATSDLAVVQKLNTFGAAATFDGSTDGVTTGIDATHIIEGTDKDVALGAIVIDSRYSSYGMHGIFGPSAPAVGVGVTDVNADKATIKTGTLALTISCTDKDATAEVTGNVVVRS